MGNIGVYMQAKTEHIALMLPIVKAFAKAEKPLKLEIGAGARKMPGWITLDMHTEATICANILEVGIPLPDESVSEIYSSHFLEHFYMREIWDILAECMRVMRPGGVFKISVPDASLYVRGYLGGFYPRLARYEPGYFYNTPIDTLNYIAYLGGAYQHKHMFDMENLLTILAKAGFRNVTERTFEQGLDVPGRDEESIYAGAVK